MQRTESRTLLGPPHTKKGPGLAGLNSPVTLRAGDGLARGDRVGGGERRGIAAVDEAEAAADLRAEERRVGREGRARGRAVGGGAGDLAVVLAGTGAAHDRAADAD